MVHKPQALSFEAAACLPCAGVTALQALRDNAGLRAGQRVLINGAAGGVGTMAVQIAKSLGASVTGVCGSSSVELVRSLGADSVIDYSMQDFARGLEPFDVVLDLVGNRTLRSLRRAAGHDGVVVVATGPSGKWIGPLRLIAEAKVKGRFVSQRLETLMANVISTDLDYLAQLCLSGALTPIVERTFPLAETATAMSLLETGHVHGKVVIDVATSTWKPAPLTRGRQRARNSSDSASVCQSEDSFENGKVLLEIALLYWLYARSGPSALKIIGAGPVLRKVRISSRAHRAKRTSLFTAQR